MSTSTSNSRAPPQQKIEFQFVNSTPLNPSMTQDLAVRAMIRKQAMKKASAARRRDGNYGKQNLRQYPVFLLDQKIGCEEPTVKVIGSVANKKGNKIGEIENGNLDGKKKEDGVIDEEKYAANTHRPLDYHSSSSRNGFGAKSFVNPKTVTPDSTPEEKHQERQQLVLTDCEKERWHMRMGMFPSNPAVSISPSVFSPTSYELMLSKFGFDIVELSTLATLHVGRSTRRALCQSPESIVHQMRTQKQWGFLSFLPGVFSPFSFKRTIANSSPKLVTVIAPASLQQSTASSHAPVKSFLLPTMPHSGNRSS